MAVKLLGVGYLVYIGFKSMTNKIAINTSHNLSPVSAQTSLTAFKTGFLTNALNPKTMFFVISVYTQVIRTGNFQWLNFSYGVFISFVHWLWFSLIAFFFISIN